MTAQITKKATPLLKWAGGKTQLLKELISKIPEDTELFAEPFIGGGALLIHLLQDKKYKNIKEVYISDDNPNLINLYTQVKDFPEEVIKTLSSIEKKYNSSNAEERSKLFYKKREEFNEGKVTGASRAACMIFLNKTCFNGLWRVNPKGQFNVPFNKFGITEAKLMGEDGNVRKGRGSTDWAKSTVKKVNICNAINIREVSRLFNSKKITMNAGSYKDVESWVTGKKKVTVYFDPPYRPLNKTSSFNEYSKDTFNDESQRQLAELFFRLKKNKMCVILSNSNPESVDPDDKFFRELYDKDGINYSIVNVSRFINSNASKRKGASEILIYTEKKN